MSEATVQDFDDAVEDEFGSELPGRPRRKFLNQWSAALLAIVVGAIGFYVGVRVEKSNVSGGGTAASGAGAFASGFAGAGGKAGTTGKSTTGGSSGTSGSNSSSFASRFAGGLAGGAAADTTGTVAEVEGNALYVKESSGNTVKVTLSDATTITKSQSVSKKKINPGDSVTIGGPSASNGSITATSVTDSGDSSTSTSTSSTSSGSTGRGASSVISSLFGGR